MAHFFIAAAHKSAGKTSVAVGLTAALVNQGLTVQTFKKGPDYIDPLWLSRATGRACYNLDFFTQSGTEICTTFCSRSRATDIGVIEGNKGLFDGLDVGGSDCNAALAKLLCAPVILVIDSGGMTRGVAPLIRGYLDFDPDVNIRGVILNKVGGARHESKLRAALERYTDTEVLGAIELDAMLEIPERHLGLIPANEIRTANTRIARLADAVSAAVDLDRILGIARTAGLPSARTTSSAQSRQQNVKGRSNVRIAIARDAAFGFYYPDDLEVFTDAGVELISFDTLSDVSLPAAEGLFIGGGFPETHLAALSANQSLLEDIRGALAAGMPAYAECGGLMYLARSIQWRGDKRNMVGAVPADVIVGDHPQGRGYMVLEETGNSPWPPALAGRGAAAADIPAHEFHYARLENMPDNPGFAYRVVRGAGIDGRHDGIVIGNLLGGFAHHRNTVANPWVKRFVNFVREKSGCLAKSGTICKKRGSK